MKKRLAVLMMVILMVTLFPATVFASGEDENQNEIVSVADDMYSNTRNLLIKGLGSDSLVYGNEWLVMALARAGALEEENVQQYYTSVEDTVKELGSSKLDSIYATANTKVILALSALGEDATDISGYNLLEPLADMDYITEQGVNAAMYALLALDSNGYEIPVASEGVTQTTREGLIQYILDAELADGGWDWTDSNVDPDLTATGLQALAPYYNSSSPVMEAVDRGLQALSGIQNSDGSFSSWGIQNACSTAQVLTAVTVLGIDPLTDSRFVKNGYSLLDGLEDFYMTEGGFRYDFSSTEMDVGFSTVQAFYALVSYRRMCLQQNSLFDMTDAFSEKEVNTGSAPVVGGYILVPLLVFLLAGILLLSIIISRGMHQRKNK